MANDRRENVSALVDDEVRGAELRSLLDDLRQDSELQGCWSRYHLVSDALHANLSLADATRLSERVWAALEDEPTVLAPRRNTRLPPLTKQVAGLAIAASVAAIAIFSVQSLAPKPATDPFNAQVAQVAQVVPPTMPGNLAHLAAATEPSPAQRAAMRDNLNPYLVNHNEYSVSSGMQGVLPYARIVSYESNQ